MQRRHPFSILIPAIGMLLLPALACGGFQVRITPTASPSPAAVTPSTAAPSATAAAIAASETVEPTAGPGPTSTRQPGGLAIGGRARVAATGGLNVREQPGSQGRLIGKLNPNAQVKLTEGPAQANGYEWWKADNGAGLTGWVALGPANDRWLVALTEPTGDPTAAPAVTPQTIDRAIAVGDRVQVTTDAGQVLTVRSDPGTGATPLARVVRGAVFTVRGGPIEQNNLVWWELEGDAVKGWAAEGSGGDRWLMPLEP